MKAICLHDKTVISEFLTRNVFLNIYGIGDLDDFFWPYTFWFGQQTEESFLSAIGLLYVGSTPPTLLALNDDIGSMQALLSNIIPWLPRRFYSHLSPNLKNAFLQKFEMLDHGIHYKMGLKKTDDLGAFDTSRAAFLNDTHENEIKTLYGQSYPENWFDPRMLKTGHYVGIREKGELVSIAGVHVYSLKYRVAALGNITTHPRFRGRGFGKVVTAKLCKELLKTVDHVGLNVKAGNEAAISLYKEIGFEVVGVYEEFLANGKELV